MIRIALVSTALLAVLAAPAFAVGGIDFTWGTGCWADNPATAKTFACNTNTGDATFCGSFTPPHDQPNFVGIEVVVDGQSDSSTLPAWWQLFNGGACRELSLTTSAGFTTAPGGCADPWLGNAAGGIAAWQTTLYPPPVQLNVPAPNRLRLKVAYAMAAANPLKGGTEYYGFRATINYAKTVGRGACGGCATPVVFVLNGIKSAEVTGPLEWCETPVGNQCLTWQGGGVTPCSATASHDFTWGQVKSLYR